MALKEAMDDFVEKMSHNHSLDARQGAGEEVVKALAEKLVGLEARIAALEGKSGPAPKGG